MANKQVALPKIGVCIVRVETQPETLIIAVSARRDIGRGVHTAFEVRPRYFTEPGDALAAVMQFLNSFQTPGPTVHEPVGRR